MYSKAYFTLLDTICTRRIVNNLDIIVCFKNVYSHQCDQIKIAKCLQKLPKNGFTRKMNDFDIAQSGHNDSHSMGEYNFFCGYET